MFKDINGREVFKASEVIEKLNQVEIKNSFKLFVEDEDFEITNFFANVVRNLNDLTNLSLAPKDILKIDIKTGFIFNMDNSTRLDRKDFFLRTFKDLLNDFDKYYEAVLERNSRLAEENCAIEEGLKELDELMNPDSIY